MLGILHLELLYVVGFLTGCLTVFFDIAALSFLPTLVPRTELVRANSLLETRRSFIQIAGPSLAGGLIQLVTAPLAIVLDAGSFVLSAWFLARLRTPEPQGRSGQRPPLRASIGEGLREVFGHPLLRPIALSSAVFNIALNVLAAGYILFATRDLGIAPGLLGLVLLGTGIGGLIGASAARAIQHRFGLGRTLVGIGAIDAVGCGLIPLAGPMPTLAIPLLVSAQLILGFGAAVYKVNQKSLRQALTADELQGRINATMRFVTWGTMPIGALVGGWLAQVSGVQPALAAAAAGMLLASVVLWCSLVARLPTQPQLAG